MSICVYPLGTELCPNQPRRVVADFCCGRGVSNPVCTDHAELMRGQLEQAVPDHEWGIGTPLAFVEDHWLVP